MRKYNLTLEDDHYNKLEFEDHDLYMLCKFLEDAMKKAPKKMTATISIIEEKEVTADDNL